MRTLATLVCTALVIVGGGCGPRQQAKLSASRTTAAPAPEPRYAAFEPASGGSQAFGTFVRAREPQLQFCYGESRATSPALSGSATVAVTLAPTGRVVKADVLRHSWSGGDGSADVERCMLARVRTWTFPAADPEDGDAERVHSFAVIFTR